MKIFPPLFHKHKAATLLASFLICASSRAEPLLLAGGNEAFLIDSKNAEAGKTEKLWHWSGADAKDLPDDARRSFEHLDECKPVEGGAKILLCASNGGCALIERATSRILWRAHVTNAHSLALLPSGRVVVCSSLSGDRLVVFDLARSMEPVFKTPLHSAHGVVWDEKRQCLWALGFDELRAYELVDWGGDKPALKLKSTHPLPDKDGHDLRPMPAGDDLIVSTEISVQLFDREHRTFRPHPQLGAMKNVKSVDVHPATGRIVVSEWGATVRLLSPEGAIKFTNARPYKVRWLAP